MTPGAVLAALSLHGAALNVVLLAKSPRQSTDVVKRRDCKPLPG